MRAALPMFLSYSKRSVDGGPVRAAGRRCRRQLEQTGRIQFGETREDRVAAELQAIQRQGPLDACKIKMVSAENFEVTELIAQT